MYIKYLNLFQVRAIFCTINSSEIWSMDQAHEVKLYRTDMSLIRWTLEFTLQEMKKCAQLRELLGLEPASLQLSK